MQRIAKFTEQQQQQPPPKIHTNTEDVWNGIGIFIYD